MVAVESDAGLAAARGSAGTLPRSARGDMLADVVVPSGHVGDHVSGFVIDELEVEEDHVHLLDPGGTGAGRPRYPTGREREGEPPMVDDWGSAESYEPYVGRWSRAVADEFLHWLAVPSGARWLEVGCGTGALTQAICEEADPARQARIRAIAADIRDRNPL